MATLSVTFSSSQTVCVVLAVRVASSAANIVKVREASTEVPQSFVTVNLTVYSPAVLYAISIGDSSVELGVCAPEKSHL